MRILYLSHLLVLASPLEPPSIGLIHSSYDSAQVFGNSYWPLLCLLFINLNIPRVLVFCRVTGLHDLCTLLWMHSSCQYILQSLVLKINAMFQVYSDQQRAEKDKTFLLVHRILMHFKIALALLWRHTVLVLQQACGGVRSPYSVYGRLMFPIKSKTSHSLMLMSSLLYSYPSGLLFFGF